MLQHSQPKYDGLYLVVILLSAKFILYKVWSPKKRQAAVLFYPQGYLFIILITSDFFSYLSFLPGVRSNNDIHILYKNTGKSNPFLVFLLNIITELLKMCNQTSLVCFSKHCPGST